MIVQQHRSEDHRWAGGPPAMSRDMLFISHANPEDNRFTLWLALQLAKDGYGVWCDLTKLLGGEDFWKKAEDAIRTKTVRFVYVLSKTSNVKDGPLQELRIAENVVRKDESLKDFIIPVLIDGLAHSDINAELTRRVAIPFEKSWAKGYAQLIELLERENVPKKVNFNPGAVSTWWKQQFSADRGVKREPDTYLSNLLPITSMPESIWLHTLMRSASGPPGPVEPQHRLPFAGFMDNIDLVTFASAADMHAALGPTVSVMESNAIPICDLLSGKRLDPKKGWYFVSRLLRESWERWIAATALGTYALSNRANCYFFKKADQPNLDIHFTSVSGKQTYRSVVGYATQADGTRRYWHFGIQARPVNAPSRSFLISAHVIFTSDGITPWPSPKKMHSARRRQCKTWFNEEWRDRLLATLHWLSQGNGALRIPVGGNVFVEVAIKPEQFESEISYVDPPTRKQRLLLADVQQTESDTEAPDDEEQHEDEEYDDSEDEQDNPRV